MRSTRNEQGNPTRTCRIGTPRIWCVSNPAKSCRNKFIREGSDRFGRVSSQERRKCAMPDHSQFNIDRTYPGLWTITFSTPPINMFAPTTIVELGALMTTLGADRPVKVVVFQSANP